MVFIWQKPASYGCLSGMPSYIASQYDTSSEAERRQMILDERSLARRVLRYVVDHDPAKDLRLVEDYGLEDYMLNKEGEAKTHVGREPNTLYSLHTHFLFP